MLSSTECTHVLMLLARFPSFCSVSPKMPKSKALILTSFFGPEAPPFGGGVLGKPLGPHFLLTSPACPSRALVVLFQKG